MTQQQLGVHLRAVGLLAFILASGTGAFAQPAAAAASRWTPYGPPGGLLLDLVVGSAGQLFLAAERSGVYTSRDGGRTWSWSGQGMGSQRVRALAADSTGALYAVGDSHLFRSKDSGTSWQFLSPELPLGPPPVGGDVLALSPGDLPTFYLARGSRLFRGTEGGTSWQEVLDTPAPINALLVDPRNPLSVFAGPQQQPGGLGATPIWHSADGGSSWSSLSGWFDSLPGNDSHLPWFYGTKELKATPGSGGALFAVFQYGGSVLYHSVDGGRYWQLASVPPGATGYVASVAAAPAPAGPVYALELLADQSGLGLFVTRDLGNTWARVDRGGVPAWGRLRLDPTTGDLLALADYGVARGENGGVLWHTFLEGTDATCADKGVQYDPKLRFPKRSTSSVYAVSNFNLYISDDGGASWGGLQESLPGALGCAHIGDVALDPRREETLYAVSDGGLLRTTDAGATWQSVPVNQASIGLNAVAMLDSGTILVGGCGVSRSVDQGTSWGEPLPCAVPRPGLDDGARLVARLIVDPSRPRVVYAEVWESGDRPFQAEPRLYRSVNDGRSWAPLPVAANVIAIDPRTPQTVYALGPTGLERSANDGRTWRKISDFALIGNIYLVVTDGDLFIDPSDSHRLWAARPDGVWQSIDGGSSWQQRSLGLRGRAALTALTFFTGPHRPGKLEVATAGGLFQTSLP